MKKNILFGLICLFVCTLGCADKRKYHDAKSSDTKADNSELVNEILMFQEKLNEEFENPETSPLPDRYRKDFEGLDFFQPDTSFRVMATLQRTMDAIPFMMPTTTERLSEEVVFGIVHFTLNGITARLEGSPNRELKETEEYEDYLCLPFVDTTHGEETDAGGRSLEVDIPAGQSMGREGTRA